MAAFGGVPVWHASVALRGEDGQILARADWSTGEILSVELLLGEVLEGVGRGAVIPDELPGTLQWRRILSHAELRKIGPAKDIRGTPEEERRLTLVASELL